MGKNKGAFSLKELLQALVIGAGVVVVVYLISFLLLLTALTFLTDWDLPTRILISVAGAFPLFSLLDLFTDFKDWRRRKLALKNWDERRKAKDLSPKL